MGGPSSIKKYWWKGCICVTLISQLTYILGSQDGIYWTLRRPNIMSEVTNYLEDLSNAVNNLEQKSIINNRLSEEKMLTKHLVKQIRTLLQIIRIQQEGDDIEPGRFN